MKNCSTQADKHRAKLSDPAAHDTGWRVIKSGRLVEKWRDDMCRNAEFQVVIEQLLRARGLK